jgi:adenosine deaminase
MVGLREQGIVLEICPTSNLLTRPWLASRRYGSPSAPSSSTLFAFTIATDGPEMMRTHLCDEFALLRWIGALDEDGFAEANARGHEASFVRGATVRAV